MNNFLNALKDETNYTYTENGGITHKTTKSDLLDMFALGGSMRNRSDDDVILMFKNAYAENPLYALKCLFYLRNCRGGQGERRFFRVCIRWLANNYPAVVRRNLKFIPLLGRWDDLYSLVDTPVEKDMFGLWREQLLLDVSCETPSLAAKWACSENCSSQKSKILGNKTRKALGDLTSKEYRKMLSMLRRRINIVESLMSQGRWDEIKFDKLPSKAGLKYRNAFARNEYTRERYAAFMSNKETKVNASVLNPVDIANQIFSTYYHATSVERNAWQKYWDALPDYYHGHEEPGIAVVDVSGSMWGQPLYAAVSMGAYIAERGKGPFRNHFITFSDTPELVKFEGVDIYDKFMRAHNAAWGGSTNIEAVFDLLLRTARANKAAADDMPKTIYIFSDMEFNSCVTCSSWRGRMNERGILTVIEAQRKKWQQYGYEIPRVIFWNLDARQNQIPALNGPFSYISGFSMNGIEAVLSGKDGYDLMMEVLNSPVYQDIK